MARTIGIRHRVKRTAEGEARPTQLYIVEGESAHTVELEDDTAELDWVRGRFPITWTKIDNTADLTPYASHHVKWKKLKKGEDPAEVGKTHHIKEVKGDGWFYASEAPSSYDGLRTDDTILMVLGGSGDRLAYALARRLRDMANGARLLRIAPFVLKEKRKKPKEEDALNLVEVFGVNPDLFCAITPRDLDLIILTEVYRARIEAMKARISCEQRLRQHFIGCIFTFEPDMYPEGSIELAFDEKKASDPILVALEKEEGARNRELAKVLEAIDIYVQLFKPINGVGPAIAARLMVAIGDIRRFPTEAKLRAFLGVHVLEGGKHGERPKERQFPRRRSGDVANWHPDGRQALYLLGDQFNRRPGSFWGDKLRDIKAGLRIAHPEPVEEARADNGKVRKLYSDGHIHKMAIWKTLYKFTRWLYREWTRIAK